MHKLISSYSTYPFKWLLKLQYSSLLNHHALRPAIMKYLENFKAQYCGKQLGPTVGCHGLFCPGLPLIYCIQCTDSSHVCSLGLLFSISAQARQLMHFYKARNSPIAL